jgi:amino acid transporter
MVTGMLFYFRKVYSEAVTAIPVNGGTYNIVLNIASKKTAALVACLSVLSYTATAIVSAFDSIIYLSLLWTSVDIRSFTILILAVFACVTICGVGESSYVACMMFVMHCLVLTILILWGFVYGCQDNFQIFHDNLVSPYPDVVNSSGRMLANSNAVACLFFGYCSALLGITGFETAANYVEEMKSSRTFMSTVNWMWYAFFVNCFTVFFISAAHE